jgi:hypothetical protein
MTLSAFVVQFLRWLGATTVALFLWTSLQLTNKYRTELLIPVRYEQLPEQLKLTQPLPTQLRVDVIGKGFDLIGPSLRLLRDSATIDLAPAIGRGYVVSQKLRPEIARVLPDGVEVRGIDPDTLRLAIKRKVSRKVPLVSRIYLDPSKGWFFNTPVQLNPDSVVLIGAASEIDTVRFWTTESLQLSGPRLPDHIGVGVSPSTYCVVQPSQVRADLAIDRYTEIQVRRRVQVQNLPPNRQVRLLPDEVDLTLIVPLWAAHAVQESDLPVWVDYSNLNPEVATIVPNIGRRPSYVLGVRSQPAYVRYVIGEPVLP